MRDLHRQGHQQLRRLRQQVQGRERCHSQVRMGQLQVPMQARVHQLRQQMGQWLRGGHQQGRQELWQVRCCVQAVSERRDQVRERQMRNARVQERMGQLRWQVGEWVREGSEQGCIQLRQVRQQVPLHSQVWRAHLQRRQVRTAMQERHEVRRQEEVLRLQPLIRLSPRTSRVNIVLIDVLACEQEENLKGLWSVYVSMERLVLVWVTGNNEVG